MEPLAQQIKAARFYGFHINITEWYARHFVIVLTKREKEKVFWIKARKHRLRA